MTDKSIKLPPAELFNAYTAVPDARTVIAEVRSDASLSFDPAAAPNELHIPATGFTAFILWRVDVSWTQAQEMQKWLLGPPAPPALQPFREAEMKDFFENLQGGAPAEKFLQYIGTFLATGVSNASYTLMLGIHKPDKTRDVYRDAFENGINALAGAPNQPPAPNTWPGELLDFFRKMLNQPSSREEYLVLAHNVADLTANAPPAIKRLIIT